MDTFEARIGRQLADASEQAAHLADQYLTAITAFSIEQPTMTVRELSNYLASKGVSGSALATIRNARDQARTMRGVIGG